MNFTIDGIEYRRPRGCHRALFEIKKDETWDGATFDYYISKTPFCEQCWLEERLIHDVNSPRCLRYTPPVNLPDLR